VSEPLGYTPAPHPVASPADAIVLWSQFRARVEVDSSLTKSEQAFLMIPEARTVIGDTIVLAVPDDFSKNYLSSVWSRCCGPTERSRAIRDRCPIRVRRRFRARRRIGRAGQRSSRWLKAT